MKSVAAMKEPPKIINFIEAKQAREKQIKEITEKVTALKNLEENSQSDSAKYNHQFYWLIDLFMQETYPDYAWRFDIWLDKVREASKKQ